MIRKIIVILTVLVIVVSTGYGLVQKRTYTDITGEENFSFYVGRSSEEVLEDKIPQMKEELPNSNVIIRATPVKEMEILFHQIRQCVRVEEVYKGEQIAVGDVIYITSQSWNVFCGEMYEKKEGTTYISTKSVNFMREGEDYLIFLGKRLETNNLKEREAVYEIARATISPIFCYEERKNIVFEGTENDLGAFYPDVSENEFFTLTEKAMELLEQLKYEMIAMYPRS